MNKETLSAIRLVALVWLGSAGKLFITGRVILPVILALVLSTASASAQGQEPRLQISIQQFPGVYRVTAETSDRKPVPADLELQVVAKIRGWRREDLSSSVALTIPRGKSSGVAELTVLTPQQNWYSGMIHVEQDDNETYGPRDLLRHNFSPTGRWKPYQYQLFVSSNIASSLTQGYSVSPGKQSVTGSSGLSVADVELLPSFRHMSPVFEAADLIAPGSVTTDFGLLNFGSDAISCIHPRDFFESWTSLYQFQSMLISLSDLKLIARSKPKLDAIRKWTAAGGMLVVFDCGEDFKERETVRRLLQANQSNRDAAWQQPTPELTELQQYISEQQTRNANSAMLFASPSSIRRSPFTDYEADSHPRLLRCRVGEGSLFVIGDDMTEWTADDWRLLHNSAAKSGQTIVDNVGESALSQYYQQRFRIPGIGQPPVLAFQVLIGLFVLIVGPGLYFLFSYRKRLYLLLITVPLFALASVLSLFAYGLISDGFSTRGRVHSVTKIDHATELAVSHARYAFYSGVSPRFCQFPASSLVADSRSEFSSSTRMRKRDGNTKVAGGQIKARTPFQLTSYSCQETDGRLSLEQSEAGSETATVINSFDDPVSLAVIRTDDGWYLAESIGENSSVAADKATLDEIKKKVQSAMRIPADQKNEIRVRNGFQSYRRRDRYFQQGSGGKWGMSGPIIGSMRSMRQLLSDEIPVNSYFAIMNTNSLVSSPQPDAVYNGNEIHVVIGQW